jgi:predicted dithiol-disulfide oxidoreductase (DUF899 family)
MTDHKVGTREEWLAARVELLEREKELTRRSDELARVGCSYTADSLAGGVVHLENRDVAFVAVSRAPLAAIEAYKQRMDWTFRWVSALGNDFNLDFALFTEEARRSGRGFNFGTPAMAHVDLRDDELHGLSAFALEDGVVYHTYSCYDRGTDVINGTWQLLDRTPKGRAESFPGWPRFHDEYPRAG